MFVRASGNGVSSWIESEADVLGRTSLLGYLGRGEPPSGSALRWERAIIMTGHVDGAVVYDANAGCWRVVAKGYDDLNWEQHSKPVEGMQLVWTKVGIGTRHAFRAPATDADDHGGYYARLLQSKRKCHLTHFGSGAEILGIVAPSISTMDSYGYRDYQMLPRLNSQNRPRPHSCWARSWSYGQLHQPIYPNRRWYELNVEEEIEDEAWIKSKVREYIDSAAQRFKAISIDENRNVTLALKDGLNRPIKERISWTVTDHEYRYG
jgi:hypothetical protein